jgi:methylated-DNA-[protein]-cysteine S-methyltransferase
MPRTPPERFTLERFATPIGAALIVTDADGALRAVDWEDHEDRMVRLLARHYGRVDLAPGLSPEPVGAAFSAYFAGETRALEGLSWRTNGTAFQRTVWAALCDIPAGETLSYAALAAKIGAPKAVRAVGLANGANPVGVVVPCHRVIGANGALTGYGGGLPRKRWLLQHEGAAFREAA